MRFIILRDETLKRLHETLKDGKRRERRQSLPLREKKRRELSSEEACMFLQSKIRSDLL